MALNGIDVSGYQPANIGDLVPYDFLLAKATEGTNYTSSRCDQQVQSAWNHGKKAGVYHFASGAGAVAEADYFVAHVGGYVGRAMLVLDWEASAVAKGPGYAKQFLDRVFETTGVRPLIYMSASVVKAYDWSAVRAANYGLWVASYGSNAVTNGYRQPGAPSVAYWGAPVMYQYGSQGRLSGYGSNLDTNVFYGDASTWDSFAAKNGNVVLPPAGGGTPAPTPTAVNLTTYSWQQIQAKIGAAQDGIPGPETYAKLVAWQKANGLVGDGIVGPATAAKMFGTKTGGNLTVDGVWGAATTKALQSALHVTADGILGPQTYKALQGRVGVTQDGIYGPNTKKALQRYLGVAQDGIVGPNTIKALQTRLNAGTF